jgi:DnaJ-class molecular chaperone
MSTSEKTMPASLDDDATGVFRHVDLGRMPCPDCGGRGQVHIESENINENFEVEKQTVITDCSRCGGTGWVRSN